jgi:hypothetical protein
VNQLPRWKETFILSAPKRRRRRNDSCPAVTGAVKLFRRSNGLGLMEGDVAAGQEAARGIAVADLD